MWRNPSGCSSYGVNFFNSFFELALIELIYFWIIYFFSKFRYFSLYLFSNLAFCSFFLFLYSILVTHHSAFSDLYSSINSIQNCRSSAVPLEVTARSIVLQITTAGTTTWCQMVCLCKQALRRRKHWLLAQKTSNCFDFTHAVCASVQTTPYTVKMFAQTLCANCLHV